VNAPHASTQSNQRRKGGTRKLFNNQFLAAAFCHLIIIEKVHKKAANNNYRQRTCQAKRTRIESESESESEPEPDSESHRRPP